MTSPSVWLYQALLLAWGPEVMEPCPHMLWAEGCGGGTRSCYVTVMGTRAQGAPGARAGGLRGGEALPLVGPRPALICGTIMPLFNPFCGLQIWPKGGDLPAGALLSRAGPALHL